MNPISILLVDDESDFIETLAERLRLRGFGVETALSGKAALDLMRRKPFQGVVLDLMMPGMDGLQTLKEIRQINHTVEVILLTGHTRVDTALEGVRTGAFDYLIKPVDIDELSFRLHDACEKRELMLKSRSV